MELKDSEEACLKAFLGYAQVDILELNPIWRTWNKHLLVESQVSKTVDSFIRNGIRRFAPSSRIPLIVPRDWVKVENLQSHVGMGGDDLPQLEWTDKADKTKIYGASGQHRFKALMVMKEKWEKSLEKAEKEFEAAGKGGADAAQTKEEAGKAVRLWQKKIKRAGRWGVVLYDYGAQLWIDLLMVSDDHCSYCDGEAGAGSEASVGERGSSSLQRDGGGVLHKLDPGHVRRVRFLGDASQRLATQILPPRFTQRKRSRVHSR